jgi:hypothetical protein
MSDKLEKLFNTAKKETGLMAKRSIKNNMNFCVHLVDTLVQEEEGSVFPSVDQVDKFILECMNEVKRKELNERAIEGMKKKHLKTNPNVPFTLPKQPCDITVFVIASSDEYVHVGISVPEKDSHLYWDKLDDYDMNESVRDVREGDRIITTIRLSPPESVGVFKHQDEVKRRALNALKEFGIYVEEKEEEFDLHLDDIV